MVVKLKHTLKQNNEECQNIRYKHYIRNKHIRNIRINTSLKVLHMKCRRAKTRNYLTHFPFTPIVIRLTYILQTSLVGPYSFCR